TIQVWLAFRRVLSRSHTHTHTHTNNQTLTHSLTHSQAGRHTHTHTQAISQAHLAFQAEMVSRLIITHWLRQTTDRGYMDSNNCLSRTEIALSVSCKHLSRIVVGRSEEHTSE